MSDDHHLPARRNALPIVIGLIVAALFAVVAVRCSSREHAPAASTSPSPTQGAEPPTAAAPVAASEPVVRSTVEPAVGQRDGGATTTLGRLMQVTDVHDRAMLADIEQKAKQAPSNSVYRLLELRRAGKSRADLERFIQRELEGGITVRLVAMKWLRAIHGEPEPAPSNGPLLRQPGEPDAQPRIVKPLTKTTP